MRVKSGFPNRAMGLFLAAAVAVLAGCSGEPGDRAQSPPPVQGEIDLEAPNGGVTATPEAPAFGDAALLDSVEDEIALADPIEEYAEVRDMVGHPGSRLYVLTAVWGILRDVDRTEGPMTDGTSRDWSGSVAVTDGAVVLRSVISFEPEDGDSILKRTRREELVWRSFTGEGFDGLRLLLVRPPRLGEDPAGKDSVRFVAGSFARTFSWNELQVLDEEYTVDDAGNRIVFSAHQVDPTAAHLSGHLRGRWDAIPEGDSVGHFQGVWVGQHGHAFGLFRGVYGTRSNGDRVFFGKYIDPNGNFLGILRGRWEVSGVEPGPPARSAQVGWFRGEWVDANEVRQGDLFGRWRAADEGHGFLRGQWCRGDCPGRP